jgi:hypothetical protein
MARVFMVTGGKGGVGKSMTSIALLDYLEVKGRKVTLVETDSSNPDVGKAYQKDVKGFSLVNLDENDGWLDLLDIVEAAKTPEIVINTAARNTEGIGRNGEMFDEQLGQLGYPVISLFVINNQRDSVEILDDYARIMHRGALHVVRNQFYGASVSMFDIFNQSALKKDLEERGGRTLDLPKLATRVANLVQSNRLTLQKAWQTSTLGSKAEIERWRRACATNVFDEVCADANAE